MKILLLFLLVAISFTGITQSCKPVIAPQLSQSTKTDFESRLELAIAEYKKDSTSADAIIWYGRRTAYLGNYEQAIEIFSKGIALHPADARFYRHRGHRYITVRCLDKAIEDFQKAADLMKRQPDQVEPDGLPNAKNIPTSTLQSNIWYHLGLAYYLKGDFKNALKAYRVCLSYSKNPDMYVATANWMFITLKRLNKHREAEKLLATIDPGLELIENKDYFQVLLLYKNQPKLDDPLKFLQEKKDLSLASFGYGLGLYLLFNGDKENARRVFKAVTDSNQWAAFGFIAAEKELEKF